MEIKKEMSHIRYWKMLNKDMKKEYVTKESLRKFSGYFILGLLLIAFSVLMVKCFTATSKVITWNESSYYTTVTLVMIFLLAFSSGAIGIGTLVGALSYFSDD